MQVSGIATYRERLALPPGACFETTVEDTACGRRAIHRPEVRSRRGASRTALPLHNPLRSHRP